MGEQEIPYAALVAPLKNYNMQISGIIGQLLNITKEDDKKIIMESLRLVQEDMALTIAASRDVAGVPQRTVLPGNRGPQNKGSRS